MHNHLLHLLFEQPLSYLKLLLQHVCIRYSHEIDIMLRSGDRCLEGKMISTAVVLNFELSI